LFKLHIFPRNLRKTQVFTIKNQIQGRPEADGDSAMEESLNFVESKISLLC